MTTQTKTTPGPSFAGPCKTFDGDRGETCSCGWSAVDHVKLGSIVRADSGRLIRVEAIGVEVDERPVVDGAWVNPPPWLTELRSLSDEGPIRVWEYVDRLDLNRTLSLVPKETPS